MGRWLIDESPWPLSVPAPSGGRQLQETRPLASWACEDRLPTPVFTDLGEVGVWLSGTPYPPSKAGLVSRHWMDGEAEGV